MCLIPPPEPRSRTKSNGFVIVFQKNKFKRKLYYTPASSRIEALRIGAKFPPIKFQRIIIYYPGDNDEKREAALILDGIHRWSAHKECGYKKIKAAE